MATPIETEVKIRFPRTADAAYELIEELGYAIQIPRTLEADQLFDRAEASLRAADQVLRLRLESSAEGKLWKLTYKGPSARELGYKSREEIETRVADGDNLILILSRLGYMPAFRYEKYRTTFAMSQQPGIITVDETPLGIFLELEGPKEWIDDTAKRLGFSPYDYVTSSYATLWRQYLEGPGNGPENMIFLLYPPAPERKDP
jgi:adenylate cyclase class 2